MNFEQLKAAIMIYRVGDEARRREIYPQLCEYIKMNRQFSIEYFFDKSITKKVVAINLIPTSPAFEILGEWATIIREPSEEEYREYLTKIQNNTLEDTYGLFKTQVLSSENNFVGELVIDTGAIYSVEHT